MPLYANGLELIRANLELLKAGERPKVVSIGYLTEAQHQGINAIREKEGQPLLGEPLVLFMGRHLYESRAIKDGYSIDDIMEMVESAMSDQSVPQGSTKMTGMMNHTRRADAYDNQVRDMAVFELYAKRPKAELLSVIPKGDTGNRPIDQQK
jgi:hypothetical protein